jgi:tRNA(Ile)-lysidine synthase
VGRLTMDDLTATLLSTIKRYGMFESGDSVVCAVSGGPDSVCMLRVLDELSAGLSIRLVVACLDHSTRDGESQRDAAFVERFADSMGLECHVTKVDVAALKPPGVSFEVAAREFRYEFLERVAKATRSAKVAVGHTANDQAETMLMRILSGTGLRGLAGIRPVRPLGDVILVRPLIDVKRSAIMIYLESNNALFRIDETNSDPSYLRNKIRLELIPTLEKGYNRNVVDALSRAARVLQEEEEYLSERARETAAQVAQRETGDGLEMSRAAYAASSPVLRRRLIMDVARKLSDSVPRLTLASIESADALCVKGRTGTGMSICDDVQLIVEHDRVLFRKLSPDLSEPPIHAVVSVPVPGRVAAARFGIEVQTRIFERTRTVQELVAQCGPTMQFFDAEKVRGDLFLRTKLPGDRFYPLGLGGAKKLGDYFTDAKYPRDERRHTVLLLSGEDIMWVIGGAVDERFKLTDDTRDLLEVRCARIGQAD